MSGLHTVHVRVNDAASGEPTPVRIRFTRQDGSYLAPFGRLTDIPCRPNEDVGGNLFLDPERSHFRDDQGKYAYIDGTCEIQLPADPVRIQVRKGPEYRPILQTVTLGPGKLALRFAVERWIDLRKEGWYPGDVQAHFLSAHAALLEAAAEDLAVVNLLIVEWQQAPSPLPLSPGGRGSFLDPLSPGGRGSFLDPLSPGGRGLGVRGPVTIIPNMLAFSGQAPLLQMPGHLVVVNTLNHGGLLGGLGLLNCHRPVFPLSIGTGTEPAIDWTLADWCDQCHRKGGLVVWMQFGKTATGNAEEGFSGEVLADLINGKVDAVQVEYLDEARTRQIDEWYRLLNCGLKVPLVAGSAKVSNARALGCVRTYARLRPGEEFTYSSWIEAVRAGRTFVTNGPLLTLTVNGSDPGAVLDFPAGERNIAIRAEARSIIPFDRLELVHNGVVLAGVERPEEKDGGPGAPCTALLEGNLELPGSGWLAARCWSATEQVWDRGRPHRVAAHTSPVYVNVEGRPAPVEPISLALLVERLDKMLHWVEHGARFATDKVRQDLLGVFHAARDALIRRASG
jgi:hypothetical protein